MSAFIPFLWFIVICGALVVVFPKICDTLLYYMDRRSKIWNEEVRIEERKNEVLKEQNKLREMQRQQRGIK